jgi:hypothetical protein
MMVIYSGRGEVALYGPVVVFVSVPCIEALVHGTPVSYVTAHLWPWGAASALIGLSLAALGLIWHATPLQPSLDAETGVVSLSRPYHRLYGIRLELWGVLYALAGLALLVWELVPVVRPACA